MKKLLVCTLVMCLLLCACGRNTTSEKNSTPVMTYDFDTYSELFDFVGQNYRGSDHNNATEEDVQACQIMFENTATDKIPIPCLQGTYVELKARTSGVTITYFTSELYYKPWIWYMSAINEKEIAICIMMDQEILNGLDSDASGSDTIKSIAPEAPNIDNYQNYKNYSTAEERNIVTADGAKTALVLKTSDSDREYISFLQNGFLVTLWGEPGTATDEWLANFEIVLSDAPDAEPATE